MLIKELKDKSAFRMWFGVDGFHPEDDFYLLPVPTLAMVSFERLNAFAIGITFGFWSAYIGFGKIRGEK